MQPPLFLTGKAQDGHKQGRLFGVPTANLELMRVPNLTQGIYLGYARIIPELVTHPSIIFWGKPHALSAVLRARFEVHLLKQDLDLYGTTIEVRIVAFVRENMEFANQEMLKNAIQQDLDYALKYFKL